MRYPDLTPVKDPKGGSPKTPLPTPYSDFQSYLPHPNGTIWKMTTTGICGLFIGMTVAWFTALQTKGVSAKEMQEYVDKNSPYSHDKEMITLQQSSQDQKIGELTGKQDRIFDRLSKIDEKVVVFDRDITDHDKKIKTIVDYMEAEKTPRR